MPLRPFPVPLRVGTDICHVPRIRRLVVDPQHRASTVGKRPEATSNLARFMQKFLSAREQSLFWARHDTAAWRKDPSNSLVLDQAAQYLAGRWAAKEAVIKAVSASRTISFMDVEILPRPSGSGGVFAVILDRPTSPHTSGAQDDRDVATTHDADGQVAELSISHDGEYATATCIAPCLPTHGDVGGEAAAREP